MRYKTSYDFNEKSMESYFMTMNMWKDAELTSTRYGARLTGRRWKMAPQKRNHSLWFRGFF